MNLSQKHLRLQPNGFSLFEVVLATVILSTSLAAISTLMEVARISVSQSTREVEALIRCESLVDEIILTAEPVASISSQPFEDDSNWNYSITAEPTEIETLQQVAVQVTHAGNRKQRDAHVELTRLIYTPVSTDEQTQ